MKIAIGSDKAGYGLKEAIVSHLKDTNHVITDIGPYGSDQLVAFVEIADQVSEKVSDNDAERGILICGTGMGMAITANKHKGIYAAAVESAYTAKLSRLINNANVLCMGGFLLGSNLATEIVDVFLETEYLHDFEPWRVDFLNSQIRALEALESKNFIDKNLRGQPDSSPGS